MGRAERITSAVRSHDYKLFAKRDELGKICLFREGKRIESFDLGEGQTMHYVRSAPHFVFALTHNWKANGIPVDWGIEPIMKRLRDVDLWTHDLAEKSIRSVEKAEESMARERKNMAEAFFSDFHSQFKKTTADINTANLAKKYRKERFKE